MTMGATRERGKNLNARSAQSEPSEVLIRLARSRTIIDATADFYLD